jgi:hypothetical protein
LLRIVKRAGEREKEFLNCRLLQLLGMISKVSNIRNSLQNGLIHLLSSPDTGLRSQLTVVGVLRYLVSINKKVVYQWI